MCRLHSSRGVDCYGDLRDGIWHCEIHVVGRPGLVLERFAVPDGNYWDWYPLVHERVGHWMCRQDERGAG